MVLFSSNCVFFFFPFNWSSVGLQAVYVNGVQFYTSSDVCYCTTSTRAAVTFHYSSLEGWDFGQVSWNITCDQLEEYLVLNVDFILM